MKRKIHGIACYFADSVPQIFFGRDGKWKHGYITLDKGRLRKVISLSVERLIRDGGNIYPTEWGWIITFGKEV